MLMYAHSCELCSLYFGIWSISCALHCIAFRMHWKLCREDHNRTGTHRTLPEEGCNVKEGMSLHLYVHCSMTCGFVKVLKSYVDLHCIVSICIILCYSNLPYSIWMWWMVCRCLSNFTNCRRYVVASELSLKLSFIINVVWTLFMMSWMIILSYKFYLTLRSWNHLLMLRSCHVR